MNPFSDHPSPQPITLHISAHPEPVQPSLLPKSSPLKKAASTLLTFGLIFGIFQISLNWSAYQANVGYFWDNQILPVFISDEIPTPNKLPELGITPSQNQFNEPLQITVAPLDFRLIIPKIDQNVPIMETSEDNLMAQNWNALEKQLQSELQNGVVHYPTTAFPGELGNMVINGHSSYFPWDKGRFKTTFALLDKLAIGDTFTIFHNQTEHNYQITDKKIIQATDVSILSQTGNERVTLITCWPTGTNLKRMAIVGEPIN